MPTLAVLSMLIATGQAGPTPQEPFQARELAEYRLTLEVFRRVLMEDEFRLMDRAEFIEPPDGRGNLLSMRRRLCPARRDDARDET